MDRKTANREWRDVMRGAPEGPPASKLVHAFAQRVESIAIAGCDRRHAKLRSIGGQLSNVAFNLAQCKDRPLGARDVELLDKLRREWDEAIGAA